MLQVAAGPRSALVGRWKAAAAGPSSPSRLATAPPLTRSALWHSHGRSVARGLETLIEDGDPTVVFVLQAGDQCLN